MADGGRLNGLELRSCISRSGVLEISLQSVAVPEPSPDEIIVRVEATPEPQQGKWTVYPGFPFSSGGSTSSIVETPVRWLSIPVSSIAREGEQRGEV